METVNYGKKQYFILLALSVATTLLIPLICDIYIVFVCLKSLTGLVGTSANIVSYVEIISEAAGSAVMIFSAIKYRFKLCLPFAGVTVLSTLLSFAFYLAEAHLIKSILPPITYTVSRDLIWCVFPFVCICIARFFSKRMHNEVGITALTFLGIMVVKVIFNSVMNFSYFLNYQANQINITSTKKSSFDLLNSVSRSIPSVLKNYFCIAIVYLVIRLLFTENKKAKITKISATMKKLWSATAK